MSDKLPALHFYPGDWKRDTELQALDPIDRYVWFECLLIMHSASQRGHLVINGRPMTVKEVARVIAVDEETVSKSLANLQHNNVCGVRDDGAIFSGRMVEDEELRQKKMKAGSFGGSAKATKQKPSKPPSKTLAASEVEDEDKDVSEVDQLKKGVLQVLPDCPADFLEPMGRWLAYKKSRREPYKSADSLKALLKRVEKWGAAGFVEAVESSIANNYAGIFEPKGDTQPRNHGKPSHVQAIRDTHAKI